MTENRSKCSGQTLLITLLVLTVASTIALSLIGRATIDLSISRQIEESSRAFNAAEAGIEEALRTGGGTVGPQVLTPGVTYQVTTAAIGGTTGLYELPRKTPAGTTETIWLVNHLTDGTLDETPVFTAPSLSVCWSKETVVPALVMSILYKEGTDGTYKVARMAVDPDGVSRGNNFDSNVLSSNGCGLGEYYQKTVDFAGLGITVSGVNQDTLLALRVRPEYSATLLAFDTGATTLPQQGTRIESTGLTDSGITRKVVVYQQYRSPATIFDAVIFSQSSFGR